MLFANRSLIQYEFRGALHSRNLIIFNENLFPILTPHTLLLIKKAPQLKACVAFYVNLYIYVYNNM